MPPPLQPVATAEETQVTDENRQAVMRAAASSLRLPDHNVATKSSAERVFGLFQDHAPLGYMLPFQALDYIEILARYNPDYSQAVDNIKTLANSGHTLFVDHNSASKGERIKARLLEKARTIQQSHGGIDGLVGKLLDQAATYGAIAGEWVENEDLDDIIDFVDVNPKAIRYFWEKDGNIWKPHPHWAPYQKVSAQQAEEAKKQGQKVINNCVQLNELTFFYFAFDAAPGSPYGTPPFLAALQPISIQRDMVENLAQIVKKVGLLSIVDVKIEALQKSPNESDNDYISRAKGYLQEYATAIEKMVAEGGIAHFDDAEVSTTSISGNAAGASAIFKQNEELVFSGLKSMPSVQGRCLDPNTRITMADGSTRLLKQIEVGDQLLAFDEHTSSSRRRWRVAKVENVWEVKKPSVRLYLSDGRSIVASTEHPFLMQKQGVPTSSATGNRLHDIGKAAALRRWRGEEYPSELRSTDWKAAGDIVEGDWIRAIEEPLAIDYESADYKAGYLAGANNGDGCYRTAEGGKYAYWQIGVQLSDEAIINRCEQYARDLGVREPMRRHTIQPKPNPKWPNHHPVKMVVLKTTRKNNLSVLFETFIERDSHEYRAGWLAGLFDTDGCYHLAGGNKPSLRFAQNPGAVYDRAVRYLRALGFGCSEKNKHIEVLGDRVEKWRFTATVRPTLERKTVSMEDFTVRIFKPIRVERVEKIGKRSLIDLTTSTATLLGNGLLTHNSYSTTETYAGVAYDIIIRNTFKYQRAIKRLIESGYWLMVTLWGENPRSIRLEFNSNKSLHRLQDAQAELLEIKIALMLWASGVLDQLGFAQELGYSTVATEHDEIPDSQILGNTSPGGGAGNTSTDDQIKPPASSDSMPDQFQALLMQRLAEVQETLEGISS